LFGGARDALARLRGAGVRLGVVTSAPRDRIDAELATLGLDDVFAVVVSHDDVANKKPHPEGLEHAIAKLGVGPRNTCYVGDAPQDIEMAERVGAIGVAVRSA